MSFELLGHDCPLGSYPAPVVPIGVYGGTRVAVYPGDDRPDFVEIDKGSEFVRHSGALKRRLRNFDPECEHLFGLAETDVVSYPTSREANFFLTLLEDNKFSAENPFLRFSLAKVTLSANRISQELNRCLSVLTRESEAFANSWRAAQLKEISGLQRQATKAQATKALVTLRQEIARRERELATLKATPARWQSMMQEPARGVVVVTPPRMPPSKRPRLDWSTILKGLPTQFTTQWVAQKTGKSMGQVYAGLEQWVKEKKVKKSRDGYRKVSTTTLSRLSPK